MLFEELIGSVVQRRNSHFILPPPNDKYVTQYCYVSNKLPSILDILNEYPVKINGEQAGCERTDWGRQAESKQYIGKMAPVLTQNVTVGLNILFM